MYNETKTFNEVRTSKDFSNDFPHQFDVVFVDLPEVVGASHMQKGYHPAVVLSSNSNNKNNINYYNIYIYTMIILLFTIDTNYKIKWRNILYSF